MATYYVDGTRPDDSGDGLSEAAAKKTLAAGFALLSSAGDRLRILPTATYTLTSTTGPTAGVKGDISSGRIVVEGYGGDGSRPTITTATNSTVLITLNDNDFFELRHLRLTSTASTKAAAVAGVTSLSSPVLMADCVVDGCSQLANSALLSLTIYGCEVANCSNATAAWAGAGTMAAYSCDFHDNAGAALRGTAGTTTAIVAVGCVFDTNAYGIQDPTTNANVMLRVAGCTFVDNTNDGIELAAKGSNTATFEALADNVFWGNGGYGIDCGDATAENDASSLAYARNAFGSNTSGARNNLSAGLDEITLSGDPFTSRASRDFSPNNTAGAGASLRAAGSDPGGLAGYRDVGAVQHQDAGGGSGPVYYGY